MPVEREVLTESESRSGCHSPTLRRVIACCSARQLEVGSEPAHRRAINSNRVEHVGEEVKRSEEGDESIMRCRPGRTRIDIRRDLGRFRSRPT